MRGGGNAAQESRGSSACGWEALSGPSERKWVERRVTPWDAHINSDLPFLRDGREWRLRSRVAATSALGGP